MGLLSGSMLSLVNYGDEVILFDPSFDLYKPYIAQAGGVVKNINLIPPNSNNST